MLLRVCGVGKLFIYLFMYLFIYLVESYIT
jgi:hypothetical protein